MNKRLFLGVAKKILSQRDQGQQQDAHVKAYYQHMKEHPEAYSGGEENVRSDQ